MSQRLTPALLVVSGLALASIAAWEGYRDRAYEDAAGVPTLGFGSTRTDSGRPVAHGDRTDPVRAVQRLAADADATARAIARCIGEVPLAQHEFDAFVSLAYNIGAGAFCRSTLVRKLREQPPDYAGACREILRWTRSAGQELPGLVRRRQAEYRQCMGEP